MLGIKNNTTSPAKKPKYTLKKSIVKKKFEESRRKSSARLIRDKPKKLSAPVLNVPNQVVEGTGPNQITSAEKPLERSEGSLSQYNTIKYEIADNSGEAKSLVKTTDSRLDINAIKESLQAMENGDFRRVPMISIQKAKTGNSGKNHQYQPPFSLWLWSYKIDFVNLNDEDEDEKTDVAEMSE